MHTCTLVKIEALMIGDGLRKGYIQPSMTKRYVIVMTIQKWCMIVHEDEKTI